jgi:hypothetical protein
MLGPLGTHTAVKARAGLTSENNPTYIGSFINRCCKTGCPASELRAKSVHPIKRVAIMGNATLIRPTTAHSLLDDQGEILTVSATQPSHLDPQTLLETVRSGVETGRQQTVEHLERIHDILDGERDQRGLGMS